MNTLGHNIIFYPVQTICIYVLINLSIERLYKTEKKNMDFPISVRERCFYIVFL